MRGMLLLLSLFALPALSASDAILEPVAALAPSSARRWWRASLVSVAASNALDVHSSWRKRELNGILASRDGSFGASGALFKLAFYGTSAGVQYLVCRRNPRAAMYRYLTILNLGSSAAVGATAIRNYGMARPPR
jgi:hypothetical protein